MANRSNAPENVRFNRVGRDFKNDKAVLYNRVKPENTAAEFQKKLDVARAKLAEYSSLDSADEQKIIRTTEMIFNLEQSIARCKGK